MHENETYLVVLGRDDIKGNSLFGAVLIATEQKPFGTGSCCMAAPNINLHVQVACGIYYKIESNSSIGAFLNSVLLIQKKKILPHCKHNGSAHLYRMHFVEGLILRAHVTFHPGSHDILGAGAT